MRRGRRLLVWIERRAKACLHALVAGLFGLAKRPWVQSSKAVRVVVLRFDPRLGNQVMLTPLFEALKTQLPNASLAWVGPARLASPVTACAAVDTSRSMKPWALFGKHGPLATLMWLRRQRFDLCFDASNPTHPSLSHALMARFSGARHIVGSAVGGFDALRSMPVFPKPSSTHEIQLRLDLLEPLGIQTQARPPCLSVPSIAPDSDVHGFVAALEGQRFILLNVGARLAGKQLDAKMLTSVAMLVAKHGILPVILWGAQERILAEEVVASSPAAWLAPATQIDELALLISHAHAVITCDTGPMHLSVGLGQPTCGLFVSTPIERYGYTHHPHVAVDTRGIAPELWLERIRQFIVSLPLDAPGGVKFARRAPPAGLDVWPVGYSSPDVHAAL